MSIKIALTYGSTFEIPGLPGVKWTISKAPVPTDLHNILAWQPQKQRAEIVPNVDRIDFGKTARYGVKIHLSLETGSPRFVFSVAHGRGLTPLHLDILDAGLATFDFTLPNGVDEVRAQQVEPWIKYAVRQAEDGAHRMDGYILSEHMPLEVRERAFRAVVEAFTKSAALTLKFNPEEGAQNS